MGRGELLGGYYPVEPYNFDVPPSPYLIGPLRSILEVVESRLIQLYADIAVVQMQISVQNATGVYLDAHGAFYSTPRLAGEPDAAYRPRILEALTAGKLTILALTVALTNYLSSVTSTQGIHATGHVYDLRSDPARCVADAPAFFVQRGDFVVEVDRTLSVNDAFFLDYTPLDYETYLFRAGTTYGEGLPDDPQLEQTVERIKAGGTNAVYKTVVTFTA